MVWGETVSQDVDAVEKLSQRYRVPVLSVHAPCLLISQRVWGANPIPKLERSVRAAEELGAQTVVVHPPFRWQRRYAEGFSDQVADAGGVQRRDGRGGEHVPVPGGPVFRGRPVAGTDAQARRRPGTGDFGVRAVLRPAGRQPRALHAGSVAHLDRGHRRAGHGAADGRRAGASAPVRRQRACPPTSTWCPGAAPNPPPRCARCWPPAISPATSSSRCPRQARARPTSAKPCSPNRCSSPARI